MTRGPFREGVLRTPRLALVPVTRDNAAQLWEILQQPDLREYQDLPQIDLEQFVRSVGTHQTLAAGAAGRFEWLIYLGAPQAGGEAGWVSLRIAEGSDSAEIGYSVSRPYRGRGIATEAVEAIVREGFARAQLARIRAYCVPANLSSRAVLRRAGFEEERTLVHGATLSGRPVDVVAYILERGRWEARRRVTRARRASES
jgi:ribosomal-protein-alanine N-acetyltransferase